MPLYDFLCSDCGHVSEILVVGSPVVARCHECGSTNLKKMLSAHSSLSGVKDGGRMPGAGDTACCGHQPGMNAGCAGPGSCCGKGPM